jgi:hypothetical protein
LLWHLLLRVAGDSGIPGATSLSSSGGGRSSRGGRAHLSVKYTQHSWEY